MLDIGTGSGCIACTLAAEWPEAEVTAWDVSKEALAIARENAKRTNVHVSFQRVDILALPSPLPPVQWDLIVSNPPYICENEKAQMEPHVLEHEPHLALFVPDDDPLLFYRAIARYGLRHLRPGGGLYFEINAAYGRETCDLLRGLGYTAVELRQDMEGRDRFALAKKPYNLKDSQ